MVQKFAPESENSEQPLNSLELEAGIPVTINEKEFQEGTVLEVFSSNGNPILTLRKNPHGNQGERSCALEMIDGHKILLPVPYFHSTSQYFIDVKDNGDIELKVPAEGKNLLYRLDDGQRDISSIRSKIVEKGELSPEWQEIPLQDDQSLAFYNTKKVCVARLYKVPHTTEYILRDAHGIAREHFIEGESAETPAKNSKNISIEVKQGKFLIKGGHKLQMVIEQLPSFEKIPGGAAGSFEDDTAVLLTGTINGGRRIALGSFREVGVVKTEYSDCNEDNAGFNIDTAVVADGLGGNMNGSHASDYAVESLLKSRANFKQALNNAHERMILFTSAFRQLQEEARDSQDAWFDNGQLAQVPVPKIAVPDTVMCAVRFNGDAMETMVLGDCAIYVVRDGRIVYRSREHTYVAQQVAMGKMTKREAMTSELRSIVGSTMVGAFSPDLDTFQLQKGDSIALMSDGGIMPDSVIVDCVQGNTPEVAVKRLFEEKRDENILGGAYYDPDDGGAPVAQSSKDNTSYLVIEHD